MTSRKHTTGKKYHKWVAAGIWILVLLLLLVSVLSVIGERKKRVFTVGNEKIYMDEVSFYALQFAFQYHISNRDMLYEYYDGVTTYEDRYKTELQNLIIDTKVMYLCALRQGITLTKEEQRALSQNVEDTISNIGSYFAQFQIDESLVRQVLLEQQYAAKLRTSVDKTENEKKTYFHTYNLLFPTVKLEQDGTLKTNADGSLVPANASDKQKQYELAMKALELSRAGDTLEEIAVQMSLESTAGDIYGDMQEYDSQKYVDEIAGMQEGEISGIVETVYGYQIFRLISKDDEAYAATQTEQDSSFTLSETYANQLEKWKQAAGVDEKKLVGDAWDAFTMEAYIIKR